jgi:hypothetical protein
MRRLLPSPAVITADSKCILTTNTLAYLIKVNYRRKKVLSMIEKMHLNSALGLNMVLVGAATFSTMTLNIMTTSILTPIIMTPRVMTPSIMTSIKMTEPNANQHNEKQLNDNQHNETQQKVT